MSTLLCLLGIFFILYGEIKYSIVSSGMNSLSQDIKVDYLTDPHIPNKNCSAYNVQNNDTIIGTWNGLKAPIVRRNKKGFNNTDDFEFTNDKGNDSRKERKENKKARSPTPKNIFLIFLYKLDEATVEFYRTFKILLQKMTKVSIIFSTSIKRNIYLVESKFGESYYYRIFINVRNSLPHVIGILMCFYYMEIFKSLKRTQTWSKLKRKSKCKETIELPKKENEESDNLKMTSILRDKDIYGSNINSKIDENINYDQKCN